MATLLKGECDACPKTDVELKQVRDMQLCPTCYAAEIDAIEKSKKEINHVDNIVQVSRRQDQSIELKSDIFNAATVSFVELKAAIDNDETIPADQKDFALVKECTLRIKHLAEVIVNARSEHHSWVTQAHELVGKLRADQREKFKQFDISYAPKTDIKKVKTTKPVMPRKKGFDKTACYDAAKKYNVPAVNIQSMVLSRPGLSYDEAGKELAKLMGLL